MIPRGRPSWTSLSGSGSSVLRRDGDPTSEKRHRVSVFYGDPTRLYQLAFVYVSFMRILYLSSTKWQKGRQGYRAWASLPSPAACIRQRNDFQGRRRQNCPRLLQVAEALLHMQVRLGMLKADDIPSLQAPPTPAVVGGAIMLGTGAVLPQLVSISQSTGVVDSVCV